MNDLDNKIWYSLIGFFPEIKKKITSPFRKDTNPGCSFALKGNYIRFFDGADTLRNGKTAVQMYMIQNNLSFEEALTECRTKFGGNKNSVYNGIKPLPKEPVNIKITPIKKPWTQKGKDYWLKLGVTDLSSKFEVRAFSIEKPDSIVTIEKTDSLTFAYLYDNGEWKSYEPFTKEKRFKFMGTVKPYNCWWYKENETDTLLTLKSAKCYEVVKSIVVEHNLAITLNHWQSESIPCPFDYKKELTISSKRVALEKLPNLAKIKKYKRHIVVFDNDEAGFKASEYCKILINSEIYFVPETKDIADYYLATNREIVTTWLLSIINGKG